jgi:hypothetical protein
LERLVPLPPKGDFLGFLGDGVRVIAASSMGAGLLEVDRFIAGGGKAGLWRDSRLDKGDKRVVAGSEKAEDRGELVRW